MTAIESSTTAKLVSERMYALIDTHTHFDAPVFDDDRKQQAKKAYSQGICHLVLVGYLYQHFSRMYDTQQCLNQRSQHSTQDDDIQETPHLHSHIALGLHPFYIQQHTDTHLKEMTKIIADNRPLAIGEIGLDTFTSEMKDADVFAKQQRFFTAQLDMAVIHGLPVLLHIRKAHAEALAILKTHSYDAHKLGGIAHSFSGGEQEAKAFVKLGFKLGVTGQITNPNAKKLRRAIQVAVDSYGIECLVIETDCPDMTPIMCQIPDKPSFMSEQRLATDRLATEWDDAYKHGRNVPANLPWVLSSLSKLLGISHDKLAKQLWHNSCEALRVKWTYPV